jgi:NAD(P)-dependent dehydrogenase (short-subunit alcohol dehydrogenase family)
MMVDGRSVPPEASAHKTLLAVCGVAAAQFRKITKGKPMQTRRFEDKIAILTGGAKGIGRAVALRYLGEGGRLAVIDQEPADSGFVQALRRDAGQDAQRLAYIQADATDEAQVARAVGEAEAALGPADILVNNVGFGANPKPIEDLSLEEWNRFLSINLTSAFLLTRAVLPGMRARGYGRVVNLASVAGRSISEISNVHYSTAKAAILGFTRKLASERRRAGHRVHRPGPHPL